MKRITRTINISTRILSAILKVAGIAAFVLAYLLTRNVIESCTRRSGFNECTEYSQTYVVFLGLSFMLPVLIGVFLLAMGFLVDVWLSVRRNNQLVKALHAYIEEKLKW